MTASLDLNLLPIIRQGGQDLSDLPDLYAVMPPRRPAHGREADNLVLYLSLSGNAPLTAEQHTQLLERLAQKYYKTSGSVTAALRTVAEALNLYLLDRNLRSTSGGRQGIGLLVLGALRGDTFYMAHCGPVQALLVNAQETRILHDLASAGRGLGLSRTTPVRYVQAQLAEGDYLVLSSRPAPGWTVTALRRPQRPGIDSMRRLLMDYAVADMNAVLIHAQAGTGRLRLLRRKVDAPDMAHTAPAVPAPSPATPPPEEPLLQTDVQVPAQPAIRRAGMDQPLDSSHSAPAPSAPGKVPRGERQPARPGGTFLEQLGPIFSSLGQSVRRATGGGLRFLGRVFKSILPDEGMLRLPRGVMIFFALAIPLVLATVGGMVFLQRGRDQQHQVYYQQAAQQAAQAASLTDPNQLRESWNQVLLQLDKAEYYRVTPESQSLRQQANAVLDQLDDVQRLDFQPAIIGGMDDGVRVTHMVASDIYLYMLDANQGSVIQGVLTNRGYERNPNFQCGRSYGPTMVGPLIDIVELPEGISDMEDAVLLGMDAAGNLVLCTLQGSPYTSTLAQPATGLGEPIAVTVEQGNLYVLSPSVNAVWIYEDMNFREAPHLFFGNEVPPMQDVIDLAVFNGDLYLLHSDGQLTQCIYSQLEESPTTCNHPHNYTDDRPGRQSGATIYDAVFNQVSYISFPERSMFMLDAGNQAIYYFSVQFTFQTQYRSLHALPEGEATAFAVSPDGILFIAVNHAIYNAALPWR
mgnify:FL=1